MANYREVGIPNIQALVQCILIFSQKFWLRWCEVVARRNFFQRLLNFPEFRVCQVS